MGGPLDRDTPVAVLPENPEFDRMIENWENQASVRHLLDVLHRKEMERTVRAPRSPVLVLRTGPRSVWRVDPRAGTVAVTASGHPVYPGVKDDDSTVVIPAVRGWGMP